MSVSKWNYEPDKCDGKYCIGDCDGCNYESSEEIVDKKTAKEILDRIFNYCEEIDCHLPDDEKTGYNMYNDVLALQRYLSNITDVIRCKDCKWFYKESGRGCFHPKGLLVASTDFYCSRGKRKEDEVQETGGVE